MSWGSWDRKEGRRGGRERVSEIVKPVLHRKYVRKRLFVRKREKLAKNGLENLKI